MQQVITRTCEIILAEDGILRIKIFSGADIGLRDVQEFYAFINRMTGGKKMIALIDASEEFSISEEARAYAVAETNVSRIATAVITRNIASRMLVNLYIRFNKPQTPTRMFTNEKSATRWLNSFRQ